MNNNSIKNILLIALIGFAIYSQFFSSSDPVEPEPVEVIIPPISGTVEEVIEEVVEETIEIADPIQPEVITKIVVDKEYKEKYETAIREKDSLAAQNLFLKSIEINEYTNVLVDNDTLKIIAYAKTRGALLKHAVDYTIKGDTITYIPEVVNVRPKLTVLTGVSLVVPIAQATDVLNSPMAVKVDIGFQVRKGHVVEIGADTQKNVYVGYKHAISLKNLFKRKKK